jgi:ribosome maturation factor RimP
VNVSRQNLMDLLEPVVLALGYELSDLECNVGRGAGLVRLFIDREEGVDLEDCELVSRQVSAFLDVEDPIATDYNLEVSSPGLDRKLVKPAHFDRFVGASIKARLNSVVQGRRRIQGELLGRENDIVLVKSEGETYSIPMTKIDVIRLVPEL